MLGDGDHYSVEVGTRQIMVKSIPSLVYCGRTLRQELGKI